MLVANDFYDPLSERIVIFVHGRAQNDGNYLFSETKVFTKYKVKSEWQKQIKMPHFLTRYVTDLYTMW